MTAHPRLSLNQATIRRASLAEALDVTAGAGLGAIGLWREPVAEAGLGRSAALLAASGLRMSSYCRGGFFTAVDGAERRRSLDDNLRAIDETAELAATGAAGSRAVLVLVVGGLPDGSRDLPGARDRVLGALETLAGPAAAAGVTLAVEALHPMYVSDRAVVSTLGQSLDLVSRLDPAVAGVVVDTFHVWWDPEVLTQIDRAGREGRIAAYQVSDWHTPLEADVLLSRHQPGDGVIDFGRLTRRVEAAGFTGDVEVEIFNDTIWGRAPRAVVRDTVTAFDDAVAPHLARRTEQP